MYIPNEMPFKREKIRDYVKRLSLLRYSQPIPPRIICRWKKTFSKWEGLFSFWDEYIQVAL